MGTKINRKLEKIEHKTYVTKEALALCVLLNLAHLPNVARGIVFSLLKNYNANNSNKTNHSTKVNELFNYILARGCTNKGIVYAFEEADLKIMEIDKRRRNNQNIGHKSTLEEVIKSINLVIREMQVKM